MPDFKIGTVIEMHYQQYDYDNKRTEQTRKKHSYQAPAHAKYFSKQSVPRGYLVISTLRVSTGRRLVSIVSIIQGTEGVNPRSAPMPIMSKLER
jgi:hypothetical protein